MKAFIFDMDGVIFDTEKLYEYFWIEAAKFYGYAMTLNDVSAIRSTDSKIAKETLQIRICDDFDYEAVKQKRIELMYEYTTQHGVELKPGVMELFYELKEKQYKIALATTSNFKRTMDFLDMWNLAGFFDCIITGDTVANCKPDPEIYLKAANELNIEPSECYAVEDSYNGVRSAYNAGCRVVMVLDRDTETDEMKKKTQKIVSSLYELVSFIKR